MTKIYKKKGICIWCLKSGKETSFLTKPHTIPKKLNAHNIGFDICDECNKYFGYDNNEERIKYSIDKITKEILNVHKFLLSNKKNSNSWRNFKSQFFNYYHSENMLKFRIYYRKNIGFEEAFTKKFKRGIYNIFLQEYHRNTENGLDKQFDALRAFVRYGIGNFPLYYLKNRKGIRITEDLDMPMKFSFNQHVQNIIQQFGFYHMTLKGLNFFISVNEKAFQNIDNYLLPECKYLMGSGFVFDQLITIKRISQIDFTTQDWD
ncbi:HNH endonuclease [Zunongwangia profunda]|uniref:HNH endonuclease n=2 Tax=Zunongwangia profunda TaxID=398743 RepID=UPI001D18AA09|nr:HNH endonuclease [Zunongwangia profunda]MCC4227169.1 HNH endonuclease [Zunongwangia profunda]